MKSAAVDLSSPKRVPSFISNVSTSNMDYEGMGTYIATAESAIKNIYQLIQSHHFPLPTLQLFRFMEDLVDDLHSYLFQRFEINTEDFVEYQDLPIDSHCISEDTSTCESPVLSVWLLMRRLLYYHNEMCCWMLLAIQDEIQVSVCRIFVAICIIFCKLLHSIDKVDDTNDDILVVCHYFVAHSLMLDCADTVGEWQRLNSVNLAHKTVLWLSILLERNCHRVRQAALIGLHQMVQLEHFLPDAFFQQSLKKGAAIPESESSESANCSIGRNSSFEAEIESHLTGKPNLLIRRHYLKTKKDLPLEHSNDFEYPEFLMHCDDNDSNCVSKYSANKLQLSPDQGILRNNARFEVTEDHGWLLRLFDNEDHITRSLLLKFILNIIESKPTMETVKFRFLIYIPILDILTDDNPQVCNLASHLLQKLSLLTPLQESGSKRLLHLLNDHRQKQRAVTLNAIGKSFYGSPKAIREVFRAVTTYRYCRPDLNLVLKTIKNIGLNHAENVLPTLEVFLLNNWRNIIAEFDLTNIRFVGASVLLFSGAFKNPTLLSSIPTQVISSITALKNKFPKILGDIHLPDTHTIDHITYMDLESDEPEEGELVDSGPPTIKSNYRPRPNAHPISNPDPYPISNPDPYPISNPNVQKGLTPSAQKRRNRGGRGKVAGSRGSMKRRGGGRKPHTAVGKNLDSFF